MTDTRACPKRDRMTEIRQQRRDAGFSEVNVWVPDEYARAFRDLAWLFVDYSGRNLPFRGRQVSHFLAVEQYLPLRGRQ